MEFKIFAILLKEQQFYYVVYFGFLYELELLGRKRLGYFKKIINDYLKDKVNYYILILNFCLLIMGIQYQFSPPEK